MVLLTLICFVCRFYSDFVVSIVFGYWLVSAVVAKRQELFAPGLVWGKWLSSFRLDICSIHVNMLEKAHFGRKLAHKATIITVI
jgi:hypothetical protein